MVMLKGFILNISEGGHSAPIINRWYVTLRKNKNQTSHQKTYISDTIKYIKALY